MINISQSRTVTTNISLTHEESKTVTMRYILEVVLSDCYISKNGRLEYWTSYPHGSGTTTDMGEPTPLQIAAWNFLEEIKSVNK